MAKRCFVITPIGDESSSIRRHIDGIIEAAIKPALEPEYEIIVAHNISAPGTITKQIITEIYRDELVIANLTNNNANVMYELAFRHSLGKPVIIIAEKGTPLPSDVIMERTIFYQNDALGTLDLKAELQEAVETIDFDKKSSPIYDIVHEIDADVSIMEIAEQTGGKSKDIFSHILNKLNAIEGLVEQNKQSVYTSHTTTTTRRLYRLVFEYETKPEELTPFVLASYMRERMDASRFQLTDLSLDEDDREIRIHLTTKDSPAHTELSDNISRILLNAGFSGLSFKRAFNRAIIESN